MIRMSPVRLWQKMYNSNDDNNNNNNNNNVLVEAIENIMTWNSKYDISNTQLSMSNDAYYLP